MNSWPLVAGHKSRGGAPSSPFGCALLIAPGSGRSLGGAWAAVADPVWEQWCWAARTWLEV